MAEQEDWEYMWMLKRINIILGTWSGNGMEAVSYSEVVVVAIRMKLKFWGSAW